MITKDLGNIDWKKPAVELERLIRGLNPWPSAYTSYNNKTMSCGGRVVPGGEAVPGQVLAVDKKGFTVQTGWCASDIGTSDGRQEADGYGGILRGLSGGNGSKARIK